MSLPLGRISEENSLGHLLKSEKLSESLFRDKSKNVLPHG